MREWRQYAIDRYRHDNVLHHKVEYVAHAVVDAAGDFFKPNTSSANVGKSTEVKR